MVASCCTCCTCCPHPKNNEIPVCRCLPKFLNPPVVSSCLNVPRPCVKQPFNLHASPPTSEQVNSKKLARLVEPFFTCHICCVVLCGVRSLTSLPTHRNRIRCLGVARAHSRILASGRCPFPSRRACSWTRRRRTETCADHYHEYDTCDTRGAAECNTTEERDMGKAGLAWPYAYCT